MIPCEPNPYHTAGGYLGVARSFGKEVISIHFVVSARSCNLLLFQLQNTGPLLKIYIREWLAGSAVVLVL